MSASTGFANGQETVHLSLTTPNTAINEFVYAGGFSATLDGGPSFTTYCVDVYHLLSFGPTYTDYSVVPGTGPAHDALGTAAATTTASRGNGEAEPGGVRC